MNRNARALRYAKPKALLLIRRGARVCACVVNPRVHSLTVVLSRVCDSCFAISFHYIIRCHIFATIPFCVVHAFVRQHNVRRGLRLSHRKNRLEWIELCSARKRCYDSCYCKKSLFYFRSFHSICQVINSDKIFDSVSVCEWSRCLFSEAKRNWNM